MKEKRFYILAASALIFACIPSGCKDNGGGGGSDSGEQVFDASGAPVTNIAGEVFGNPLRDSDEPPSRIDVPPFGILNSKGKLSLKLPKDSLLEQGQFSRLITRPLSGEAKTFQVNRLEIQQDKTPLYALYFADIQTDGTSRNTDMDYFVYFSEPLTLQETGTAGTILPDPSGVESIIPANAALDVDVTVTKPGWQRLWLQINSSTVVSSATVKLRSDRSGAPPMKWILFPTNNLNPDDDDSTQ